MLFLVTILHTLEVSNAATHLGVFVCLLSAHSLRKFETLALNLEAPLSRLRNAFRARCASNLALAVHPLPEMLASAWHPDQGGNVPHHELVDNPGLLEALLPPPPFQPSSSSSSPPSQAGIGASVSGGSKDRKDKKDDDKWRPLLTTSEATRLLYALDPQGVGRLSLPLLVSLVNGFSGRIWSSVFVVYFSILKFVVYSDRIHTRY